MIVAGQQEVLERAVALLSHGLKVIPLGRGPEGKQPSVKFGSTAIGVDTFSSIMVTTKSTMYGVRLDGIVVLDVDENSGILVPMLEDRFGPAMVKVQTVRGTHLYYRDDHTVYPNLKAEGYPVDVKHGSGQYMVGPSSIRPCGGTYVETCGQLGVTGLTPLRPDPATIRVGPRNVSQTFPRSASGKVQVGARHPFLRQKAIEYVACCETLGELRDNLTRLLEDECEDPDTFTDVEVGALAQWAFDKHVSGNLFGASGGYFRVPRYFSSRLMSDPNALALYNQLLDKHGHLHGQTFSLCFLAMRDAGLISMSERAFQRAIKKLREVGAIAIAVRHRAGLARRQYRLAPPPYS